VVLLGVATAVLAAGGAGGGAIDPPAAHAADLDQRAYRAGLRAYVHGFAPVLHRLSQATFPPNALVSVNALTTPRDRLIVLPNVDTVYSVARLDLRDGPLVVGVPELRDRYYVLQLMDAYTNVFDYIGTRTTGTGAGDYAIVGPGEDPELPPGTKAIHSPTDDVLLLGRTLVRSRADLPRLREVLGGYSVTPLSVLATGGPRRPGIVLDQRPLTSPPVLPHGLAFFDLFNQILAEDPPAPAERRALARLRRFGIGPGIETSSAPLPAAVRRGLVRAVRDGRRHIEAEVRKRRRSLGDTDGWSLLDPRTGAPGNDVMLRAIVALTGLWANTPEEATYPVASDDDHGRPLDGRHRYRLTFPTPPPARAFWSLTMYDEDRLLVANPIDRYALGDRSPTLRTGPDGSVTIRLQHRRPASGAANWLPAPKGRFTVALRIFIPKRSVLDGRWRPPGIRCLDCGDPRGDS
jgi:hypothetical protein